MSRSDAPREQLLKPWHLLIAVVGFVAAFVWIAPARQSLSLQDSITETGISELDVAYLKAERASKQQSIDDVIKAATALVRANRTAEAEALLASRPEVSLSAEDELALSIEQAVAEINNEKTADDPDQKRLALSENSLIISLRKAFNNADIQRIDLLVRAHELALSKSEYELAGDLSEKLGGLDAPKAASWYAQCASVFSQIDKLNRAVQCAKERSRTASPGEDQFDAKLNELSLLAKSNDRPGTNRLASNLLKSNQTSSAGLKSLAEQLLAIERPADAARAYAKLASADSSKAPQWFKQAARWAEAAGKPSEAAAYLDLMRPLLSPDQREPVDDEIARLLAATGDTNALMARYKKKIDSGDRSLVTLQTAIAAALANNRTPLASQWNDLLVQNFPESAQGWVNQYNLSLANTQLPAALAAARTLVDIEPDVAEHHIRLAQVAEWSGDPELATAQWLWVSERYPSTETLTELIRLSSITLQPSLTAEALRQRAMQTKPTLKEINQLITAYELEGQPRRASAVLEQLLTRYGDDAQVMMRLAELHQHHMDLTPAVKVWDRYERVFGSSVASRLNLMELHWRLDKPLEAKVAAEALPDLLEANARALDTATDYQLRLVAEISWRYNLKRLSVLSEPFLKRIEDKDQQVSQRRRAIDVVHKQGQLDKAIDSAEALYSDTGGAQAALLHMRLLVEGVRSEPNTKKFHTALQPYLVGNSDTSDIRQQLEYWSLVAQFHLIEGDNAFAEKAYRSGLNISPNEPSLLASLLWMHISRDDGPAIRAFIEKHEALAQETPDLWTPFAIAYLQLGMPTRSLTWFERQLDSIEADYSLLLTYADALEASGRAEHAYKVRHYAIDALRPLLADGAASNENELLQQYARMVSRFGSSDQKERFTQGIVGSADQDWSSKDKFWQQEMAISWLMSTERHDLARVILAKLHEQRLEAPAWQALSVAMKQNDLDVVAQIVQSGQGISVGDNMLALRKLGRGNEAYALAISSLQSGLSGNDALVVDETYRALRQYRPGFAGASIANTVAPGIGILESTVLARHTFAGTTFGLSLNASRRQFDSSRYAISTDDDQTDLSLTLHYGGAALNSYLTAGNVSDAIVDRTYFIGGVRSQFGQGRHAVSVEMAMNETPNASTLLRLRGKQNRASANLDMSVGKLGFVRLSADATDISSRVSERKIARGLSGIAEFGIRGTMGSHSWTSSVMTSQAVNDRETSVPAELELNNQIGLDEVIGENSASLSFGASLSRGGIAENYPQVNSPRYYLNARVGHRWPEKNFGVQFDAGAGMRVIGGDELSVGFSHDGIVNDVVGQGRSRLGVNYRFHF